MEFPALKEAKGQLNAARKELADVLGEAGKDLDLSKVKSVSGDNAEKLAWVQAKNDEITAKAAEVAGLVKLHGIAAKRMSESEDDNKDNEDRSTGRKSFGDMFVESKAFTGRSQKQTATLDVEVKTLFQTTAGIAPETTRSGLLVDMATRPSVDVVTFVPQTTINQTAFVYMRETVLTNAASETAEGGEYPEAALEYAEETEAVRKIAVWLPMTDEQLEDVSYARERVSMRLPFMIRQKLDAQVLNGSGAGSPAQLRGTKNVSGIQTHAKGADPLLDAFLKGFDKVRTVAFAEPSVLYLHPTDWQLVQLLKTSDGAYLWGDPSRGGPSTAWGVPVKTTTVLTAGTGVTGDYTNYSELAVKRGIDMQISNSHADNFINGKQAVRADMRCVMVHTRPAAFATITGIA
jgi:HK97 family phage major capsid protein